MQTKKAEKVEKTEKVVEKPAKARLRKRKEFFLRSRNKGFMYKDEVSGYNFDMKGSMAVYNSLAEAKIAAKLFCELKIADDLKVFGAV